MMFSSLRPWLHTVAFSLFALVLTAGMPAFAEGSSEITQQVSVAVPDPGALLENSDRHFIFNAKLDELPQFIARTRELAPGKRIRVVMITPSGEPEEILLDSIGEVLQPEDQIGFIEFQPPSESHLEPGEQLLDSDRQEGEEFHRHWRSTWRNQLGKIRKTTNSRLQKYQKITEQESKARAAFSGKIKAVITSTVWVTSSLWAAYQAATGGSEYAATYATWAIISGIIGAPSAAYVDMWFHENFYAYAMFKRNLRIPVAKIKLALNSIGRVSKGLANTLERGAHRFNSAYWFKSFAGSTLVTSAFTIIFRVLADMQKLNKEGVPAVSFEWWVELWREMKPTLYLFALGSKTETALATLEEKGMPKSIAYAAYGYFNWNFYIMAQMRNFSIPKRYPVYGAMVFNFLFWMEMGVRAMTISASAVTPIISNRARYNSKILTQFPRDDKTIDVLLFSDKIPVADQNSILILNKRTEAYKLNDEVAKGEGSEKDIFVITQQSMDIVTDDIPQELSRQSIAQTLARKIQRGVQSIKASCAQVFAP